MHDLVLQLPPLIRRLRDAQQALAEHYARTELKFTLDGRLVGDIGEAIALEYFDIERPKARTKGVDALVRATGESVQIKTTCLSGSPHSSATVWMSSSEETDSTPRKSLRTSSGRPANRRSP